MNLLAGIVAVRWTGEGPPGNAPARKNTGPTSPNFAVLFPLGSRTGLSFTGNAKAHFHQSADHLASVLSPTSASGGRAIMRRRLSPGSRPSPGPRPWPSEGPSGNEFALADAVSGAIANRVVRANGIILRMLFLLFLLTCAGICKVAG